MNIKELIKKYEEYENGLFDIGANVACQLFLKDLEQLDEPQKVKVSEEEAKFLKTFDFNCESDVTTALYRVSRTGWGYYLEDNYGIELKDLSEGFRELENRKRLIKAILDGYEVEKEKKYFVKLKAVDQYLVSVKDEDFLGFLQSRLRSKFTRKELEDVNLGWVFDCEGVEIEEVE